VIYDLLFKASSETLLTIAADPKRLGVKIGFTSVLHTWGPVQLDEAAEADHFDVIEPSHELWSRTCRWLGHVVG
jgi:hypothetical protein